MAEIHGGLHLIPEHMRESAVQWAEHAEPHPSLLGHFFRSVLSNDLQQSAAYADLENRAALFNWAMFLYNYMPGPSWGSPEKVEEWYRRHHEQPGAQPRGAPTIEPTTAKIVELFEVLKGAL